MNLIGFYKEFKRKNVNFNGINMKQTESEHYDGMVADLALASGYRFESGLKLIKKLDANPYGVLGEFMSAVKVQDSYKSRPDIQARQIVIKYSICDGETKGFYGFHYEELPLGAIVRDESSTAYVVGTINNIKRN